MYKLTGHGLTRGEWFQPETQSLTLAERDSVSTITLGPEAPEIGFNDWILQEDGPEGQIVWRVKSKDFAVETGTTTVELEHVIKALEDQSLFHEVPTKIIAGDPSATTVSALQAVRYILSLQDDWVLSESDFGFQDSNPYEFDGDTLLDALNTISDSLDGCEWSYTMNVYPFVLHMKGHNTTDLCEMRGGRNLTTMRRSVNRSGMYTRLFPIGKNDLHLDTEHVSLNEETYGRIDHIETDQSITTKAGLLSWANGLLRRHAEPTVSISISGAELVSETGEELDRLTLNRMCRVPLPEFGTTITERIVKKTWRDWIADRIGVTVTLANNNQDVTKIIKQAGKSGGKAAKGSAKQNYLFEANGEHLYYEVFDECGTLHGILEMTEQSLRIGFDNAINSTRGYIDMTADSLRITYENEMASTRSMIQQEADRIGLVVEGYGESATVSRAAIVLAVNNGTSSVCISADEIDIDGIVDDLVGYDITAESLTAHQINADGDCTFDTVIVDSLQLLNGDGGYTDIGDAVVGAEKSGNNSMVLYDLYGNNPLTISISNNQLIFTDENGETLTFSKPASITTAKGTWSNGSFTVSATEPASGGIPLPVATTIGMRSATWGNNDGICTVSVGYEDPLSGNMIATGCTFTITDENLLPQNIKKNVTVCGVNGSYDAGGSPEYFLKGEWGTGDNANKLTITRDETAHATSLNYTVTADALAIAFDPGDYKFYTRAYAYVGGATRYTGAIQKTQNPLDIYVGNADTTWGPHHGYSELWAKIGGASLRKVETGLYRFGWVAGARTAFARGYNRATPPASMVNANGEMVITANGTYDVEVFYKSPNTGREYNDPTVPTMPVVVNVGSSGPTYTQYGFSVSARTQSSDGYHYTLVCGTGWATPFGAAGDTVQLYKKNS